MSTTYKWRPEEEHLLRLLLPTNSCREIAEQLNRRHDQGIEGFPSPRTEDAVRRKVARDGYSTEAPTQIESPVKSRLQKIQEIQKAYEEKSEPCSVGLPKEASRKILCLSDIHFPLAKMSQVERALKTHGDADICVLNGDLLEGYMFSTFEKSKRIAALDEYRATFEFVSLCSQIFPKVYLTDGNHDVRVGKAIGRAGFEQEASQIFRPNLMARIANGELLDETGLLVDKYDFSNVFYEERESWYIRIGKTIFAHPHGKGSGRPGGSVFQVANYFNSRYKAGAIDCICIGHTHKIYKGIYNQQLLIEQGCMADVMSYAHSPKMEYFGGAVNGYAVIYQDDEGNCDFNKSGPVFLGYVMPPKKSVV